MRVETAFNRVLALPGVSVTSVSITDIGLVVEVQRRHRRHICPCGWSTTARYDISRRRWRHLDLGAQRLWLEAAIARIKCRPCGRVRTEDVPWARPGARATRQFEDVLAWLAQRMDKSAIAALMRCAWRTVDSAVKRLVVEHITADVGHSRLDGLRRIGVDEISHKRGQTYLTIVVDHDTGRVVWVANGRTQEAFREFITALGSARCAQVEAITMDMSHIYSAAAARHLPNARICFDPFHVIKWTNEALDAVLASVRGSLGRTPATDLHDVRDRSPRTFQSGLVGSFVRRPGRIEEDVRNQHRNWLTDATSRRPSRKAWRRARFLLRAGAERLDDGQSGLLAQLCSEDLRLARAWELKEGLRDLYRGVEPKHVRAYLDAWCDAAATSGVPQFITLARRIRAHFDGIANAVELGLSNSRAEGINTKIRVIQRRGYGHRHPHTLAAMIHLCLGGIPISLPART